MKKRKLIGIFIGSIIIIFLIVTAFNTFAVKSKQPASKVTQVTINESQAVDRFTESITYQTVSYQDRTKFDYPVFEEFISFLGTSYPLVHEQLEVELVNDYALIFKWTGADASKNPIGLAAHYDVVPVLEGTESNWEQPPYSGNVVDGLIWGRGALDDKVGVIGIMEAVEYLLQEGYSPVRDMYFMFGFDEEIGGEEGAKAIVETLTERNVRFDFVLDEGGAIVENMVPGVESPVGVVGVSEKGSATAELSIEGSGGHSSQPKDHTNIGRISKAIAKLEDTQFKADLRGPGEDLFEFVTPEMGIGMKYIFANKAIFEPVIENILLKQPASAALIRTTIAPTIFQAGEQYNALPEKATAIVNLRVMPGESLEDVKQFLEETIDDDEIEVKLSGSEASQVSSSKGWQFEAIQQASRNVYPQSVIAPYLMFAGSDAKHYDKISENTYRFLPVLLTSEDLKRMHGTNEHLSVENFVNAIKFYVEVIKEADKH
ncbi:M20 family peptidase [Aquibacillus halophilus]|uniref:M20 family peptidase n=1 Tax=Aquibacillus halophilus TaxID=930132 RepID=UPI00129A238D|nr:M20 family peptidase [Aquibacillus halophilus]